MPHRYAKLHSSHLPPHESTLEGLPFLQQMAFFLLQALHCHKEGHLQVIICRHERKLCCHNNEHLLGKDGGSNSAFKQP